MPDEGLIRSPHPAPSRLLPAKPIKRLSEVSAIVIRVPTVVAFVTSLRFIGLVLAYFYAEANNELRFGVHLCGISEKRAQSLLRHLR